MISIFNFYKNIINEMKISLIRLNTPYIAHQDKIVEAFGLVMLSVIALLPLVLIATTITWVLN